MNNSVMIYHGSPVIVKKTEYGKGKPHNDYGLGFYCTESIELAKEWSVNGKHDGFANKYSLDLSELKILNLSDKSFSTIHWITVLLMHRVFNLKNDIAKLGKEYLLEHFALDVSGVDIIRGYRADDSYFAYAESFLNNTISVQRLSEALRLGNLGEQVVLVSPKVFQHISFLGYEIAEADVYYPLRRERNERARLEFLSNRRGSPSPDDIYLNDIIRGGISADDPRL